MAFLLSLLRTGAVTLVPLLLLSGCKNTATAPDLRPLAAHYYGSDSSWYLKNTPFFECSDKQLEQVYYYRWKLYKAHIRSIGPDQWVITEFINHVPWDRDPYCTINAASMHHIYEGRWLKDPAFMDGYISYLLQQGGNDRRYSESVTDAAYARYLVNGDSAFLVAQLDSMISIYNQWSDHWEAAKDLYYIPAMPDATEYTIASVDASGGTGGFEGGEAFRPTINSYMYANALAIARVAALKGDRAASDSFLRKAVAMKSHVEKELWNDSLQHFTDRFKVDNKFVHYWNFICGRELAGMIPWYFELPADTKQFGQAWHHVIDTSQLLGQYGFRTNEPSYEYYFRQFVFFEGKPGSQWNGPSWPYQSSQVLTGMANLLHDYKQHPVTNSDYLHVLRLFARQHYLNDSTINLVENYDPNKGGPIVHYYWSNHYNHSSFNNLIIGGLCGIEASSNDSLKIHPLIDSSIRYFCLDDLRYHGHRVTAVYDADGSRYKLGKGLTVFIDGKKASLTSSDGTYRAFIGKVLPFTTEKQAFNPALNIRKKGFPVATASVNNITDSLYQAIDGRIWYFTEITNYWSTLGSDTTSDWYAIDFGKEQPVTAMTIYPVADGQRFDVPETISIEYNSGGEWKAVKLTDTPRLVGNTGNSYSFEKVAASGVRIHFAHSRKQIAISEIQLF